MLGVLTWRLSCAHQVATERHRNKAFLAFRQAARAGSGHRGSPAPATGFGGGLTWAWRGLVSCRVLQLCTSGSRTSPEFQGSHPSLKQECCRLPGLVASVT